MVTFLKVEGKMPVDRELSTIAKIFGNAAFKNQVGIQSEGQLDDF